MKRGASAGADSAEAAFDEDAKTIWRTEGKSGAAPQSLAVDIGEPVRITGFTATPCAEGEKGLVDRYRFEVSDDGKTWKQVAEGEFSNIRADRAERTVKLRAPVSAKYFRFTALRAVAGDQVAIAELGVLTN